MSTFTVLLALFGWAATIAGVAAVVHYRESLRSWLAGESAL